MRARELHENNESDEMIVRSWRRRVLSGRMNHVPEVFARCEFTTSDNTNDYVIIDIPMTPYTINVVFAMSLKRLNLNNELICSEIPHSINYVRHAVNSVLGVKLTDLQTDGRMRLGYFLFDSEQFKTWIVAQFKPWIPFIAYPGMDRPWRHEWLKEKAGSNVTPQEFSRFNPGF